MLRKRAKVAWRTSDLAKTRELARGSHGLYNPNFAAHWCSWLTRCPLKAEITGSSPVCAAKIQKAEGGKQKAEGRRQAAEGGKAVRQEIRAERNQLRSAFFIVRAPGATPSHPTTHARLFRRQGTREWMVAAND